MIKFILYFIFLISFCFASAEKCNAISSNGKHKKEIIEDIRKRSTRSGELVRLVQKENKLEAFFCNDLGSISINVYNNSSICVYQTDIDTKIEEHLFIDLSFCSTVSY